MRISVHTLAAKVNGTNLISHTYYHPFINCVYVFYQFISFFWRKCLLLNLKGYVMSIELRYFSSEGISVPSRGHRCTFIGEGELYAKTSSTKCRTPKHSFHQNFIAKNVAKCSSFCYNFWILISLIFPWIYIKVYCKRFQRCL